MLVRHLTILAGAQLSLLAVAAVGEEDPRQQAIHLVDQICQSDYEGERAALEREYDALAPFLSNEQLKARVHYWRGFAMWRRAINGFNDSVDWKELQHDLEQALADFKEVKKAEKGFIEARIGTISCLGYVMYINSKDPERIKELLGQLTPMAKEAKNDAPDNPLRLWVSGPVLWNIPTERGGGQDKAIAAYQKGLEIVRQTKPSADRLEPSWGEPELLMSLAWSKLNRATPDPNAAEPNARAALKLVPKWHYVRDILLPQILAARNAHAGS